MAEDPEYETEVAAPAAGPASIGGLRRRGIYLLPNLFTTGVLFSGFFAIVQAMNGRFDVGAIAIFVAMVLDGMDGRVARWTNTQSEFGAQYDSIADMVAFGAAPALVAYEWALKDLGTFGWIAAFLYCAGTGIRLARFNVNIGVVDKRFFQGLPSPAAACVVAGLVWALNEYQVQGANVRWLAWGLTVFAGLTMVSSLKFYSGKDINLRKSVPFSVVVGITFGIVALFMLSSTLPEMLFILFVAYGMSGYVMWAMGRRVRPVLPEE